MEENPTRQKILLLLKKNGGMSNEELSGALNITPMGVRQHLLSLEKKGLVSYDAVRHGVGRPNFVYKLTDKADEQFPRRYDILAIDLLREIERHEGRERVNQIFRWRKDRILETMRQRLDGIMLMKDRVNMVADLLHEGGYIADVVKEGKEYLIRQYNCPIRAVSKEFPEACAHELELYREIFGPSVERKQCLAQNGIACEYRIPAA